jgi:hypothetical protein
MRERLKTLVLDADGAGWCYAAVDTLLRGLLRTRVNASVLPARWAGRPWARRLLGPRYRHLSYILDWRDAFLQSPELDVTLCNINNLVEYHRCRDALRSYPLVIILHSAAGDSMGLLAATARWFEGRRGVLVAFLGNEYDLMDEKIRFLKRVGADYVCSQLPVDAAAWLYADCAPARVLCLPHALNPARYCADPAVPRTVDIGFCGDIYHVFVGDIERTRLIRYFQERGAELGVRTDLRLNDRLERQEWAAFLRRCRGTIGAESGSYYLDRRGVLIRRAKAHVARYPDASFDEVFERFFRAPDVPYVSGKAISSRHFEPIGTKTCQLLLAGHYSGILQPGEHYIPIKADLSDLREALAVFRDETARTRIVERAYEYVMDQHTYRHRVMALLRAVRQPRAATAPDARAVEAR